MPWLGQKKPGMLCFFRIPGMPNKKRIPGMTWLEKNCIPGMPWLGPGGRKLKPGGRGPGNPPVRRKIISLGSSTFFPNTLDNCES